MQQTTYDEARWRVHERNGTSGGVRTARAGRTIAAEEAPAAADRVWVKRSCCAESRHEERMTRTPPPWGTSFFFQFSAQHNRGRTRKSPDVGEMNETVGGPTERGIKSTGDMIETRSGVPRESSLPASYLGLAASSMVTSVHPRDPALDPRIQTTGRSMLRVCAERGNDQGRAAVQRLSLGLLPCK